MDKKIYDELKRLKPILREKYGIEEFAIFGSVARGDNRLLSKLIAEAQTGGRICPRREVLKEV